METHLGEAQILEILPPPQAKEDFHLLEEEPPPASGVHPPPPGSSLGGQWGAFGCHSLCMV